MEITSNQQNVFDKDSETLKNHHRQVTLKNYIDLAGLESRKLSEDDVKIFEKQCGIEFAYLNPCCKFVFKITHEDNYVIYVNVCSSQYVRDTKYIENDSTCLLHHYISSPIECSSKKGGTYVIYDVLFNPNVLAYMSRKLNVCDFVLDLTSEVLMFDCQPNVCTTNVDRLTINKKGVMCQIPLTFMNGVKVFGNVNSSLSKKTFKNLKNLDQKNIKIYDYYNYLSLHRFNDRSCFDLEYLSAKVVLLSIYNSISILKDKSKHLKSFLLQNKPKIKYSNSEIYLYKKEYSRLILNNITKNISNNKSYTQESLGNFLKDIQITNIKTNIIDYNENENENHNFLSSTITYQLPEYSCHLFNDIIIFTLHVKNVKSETIAKIYSKNESAIHIKFSSLNSTLIEINYAFYLHIPSYTIDSYNVSVEAWDNNVVVQIPFLPSNEGISSYMIGVSEKDLEEKIIEEPSIIFNKQISKKNNNEGIPNDIRAEIHSDEDVSVVHLIKNENKENYASEGIFSSEISNYIEDMAGIKNSNITEEISVNGILFNNKNRFPSESSGDELSLSVSPTKGILKMRKPRFTISRSVSESSVDECIWSSFENYNSLSDCIIHEEHSSMKKTVRFNDVVSKQLFRSNSSILGQKKKNQRKSRNKKRAQERRFSESENSEEDKKEKYLKQPIKNASKNMEEKKMGEDDDIKTESRSELIFELDM